MKYYIRIAGFDEFYIYNIKIDIEKLFEAKLDFSSWSYEVGGFDFTIPKSFRNSAGDIVKLIPDFYQSDDIVIMTSRDFNIDRNDTRIFVQDNTNAVLGNYYWIATERIKITGKGNISLNQYIDVERGKYDTIPQSYYNNVGEHIYNSNTITKYPKTLVGQLVFIYKYGNSGSGLVKIGIINDELEFSNGNFDIKCGDLIESLDIPIPTLISVGSVKWKSDRIPFSYATYPRIGLTLLKWAGYLPAIFHYLQLPEFLNATGSDYFNIGVFTTFKDYIEFQCKLNFVFLVFDSSLGLYSFKQINFLSNQFPITEVNIKDYIDKTTRPLVTTFKGISKAIIETSSLKIEFRNPLSLSLGLNKEFNFKLPDGIFMEEKFNPNSHIQILFALFGIIYGKIKVTSHIFLSDSIIVGNVYRLSDLKDSSLIFDTLQNVSDLCYCISKDNDDIEFIIIKDQIEDPLCPSLAMEVLTYDSGSKIATLQVTQTIKADILNRCSDDFDIDNFDFKDFIQPDSRYSYFDVGYSVFIRETTTSVYCFGAVTDLTLDVMTVLIDNSSNEPVIGDTYIVSYGLFDSGLPTNQKHWAYLDVQFF